MKFLLPVVFAVISSTPLLAQVQACPTNIDFSSGNLTSWSAYTGNNLNGNGGAQSQAQKYLSSTGAPGGTIGVSRIPEYQLPNVNGIQVYTNRGTDPFGNFSTLPNITGYQYSSAVLLGSTSITRNSGGGTGGGYTRGISYLIDVPVSPSTQPYTMTYAYAMVLENGRHNSDQQPLFSATLSVHDSIISCASPQYFLPTDNTASGGGNNANLDTAIAEGEGFSLSRLPSPNSNPNGGGPALQDVWWKGWTEVTFDLSPFRGQQVKLTFEADNCTPGGHFAYAYVAIRNTCTGLQISGPLQACLGSTMTYSVPALGGATYDWTVPPGWNIVSGSQTNILMVTPTATPGPITAHEVNGCADLRDTIQVSTVPPTIPGSVSGDAEVCTGANSSILSLNGYRGNVLNWQASANGGPYIPIPDIGPLYTATDLSATTRYRAVVQNGTSCDIDTSTGATILVDPRSVGGNLLPANQTFCLGQNQGAVLTLTGNVGNVVNWESSPDAANWTGFAPTDTDSSFIIRGLNITTDYHVLVRSGVCPIDTSSIAIANFINVAFPQAVGEPADTTICYGDKASLNASITIGTNYSWTNVSTLTGQGTGAPASLPFAIHAIASPLNTTDYILTVLNAGCPNSFADSFDVHVVPPILVNAGNDTTVVINQPLQLHAVSNDPGDVFTWTPATGLNNAGIPDPIAILGPAIDSIRYVVRATSELGCSGLANVGVTVYRTGPDIFVPNAFTPDGAGNRLFRPVPVGLSKFQYFRVFNRWGQLVFSTSTVGRGWDGNLNGKPQEAGTYVWMVQGVSYLGKTMFRKGIMVLIR